MTDVYYTQADVEKISEEHSLILDTVLVKYDEAKAQRDAMIVAVRGVITCFKSETKINHPSCLEYLESVLKKVTGGL